MKGGKVHGEALKENHWEAFSKESEPIRAARWDYYKTHWPNYEHKGSYNLSSTFRYMATSTNFMGSEIHEVQEVWTNWKDLRIAHHMDKISAKDIHFFRVVPPTELPKIMGLRGIHSPEGLQRQSGLSFCLWYRKEGQNEGMVENHLWTSHYHLGLICSCCMEYFTWVPMPCTGTPNCVSQCWPALTMTKTKTGRRNLLMMTTAENIMISSHSMRICITPLTSHPEQLWWDYHSTGMTHPFTHSTQMQWGTLPPSDQCNHSALTSAIL